MSKVEKHDVEEHFKILTEKHGDTYSVPQRRLGLNYSRPLNLTNGHRVIAPRRCNYVILNDITRDDVIVNGVI